VTTTVLFRFTADVPLAGIDVRADYHPEQGSFVGLADSVSCTSNIPTFDETDMCPCRVFNHCVAPTCHRSGAPSGQDSLIMLFANSLALPFPIETTCIFQAKPGQVLLASDIDLVVEEVTTKDGVIGDPRDLGVSTDVKARF
jgi:hypothetical protein